MDKHMLVIVVVLRYLYLRDSLHNKYYTHIWNIYEQTTLTDTKNICLHVKQHSEKGAVI